MFFDDVESSLYLTEFLHKAELPWGWLTIPEVEDYETLKEKESWSFEEPPLQESSLTLGIDGKNLSSIPHQMFIDVFIISSDDPPNYTYLERLLLKFSGSDTWPSSGRSLKPP